MARLPDCNGCIHIGSVEGCRKSIRAVQHGDKGDCYETEEDTDL